MASMVFEGTCMYIQATCWSKLVRDGYSASHVLPAKFSFCCILHFNRYTWILFQGNSGCCLCPVYLIQRELSLEGVLFDFIHTFKAMSVLCADYDDDILGTSQGEIMW